MIVDFLLFVIFLASAATLWYRISLRLPQLIAIPDQVITERLHEDSARMRLLFLKLRSWHREGRFRENARNFFGKTLYRFHIILLRLDNGTLSLLKRVKVSGFVANGNGEYFQKLKSERERMPE